MAAEKARLDDIVDLMGLLHPSREVKSKPLPVKETKSKTGTEARPKVSQFSDDGSKKSQATILIELASQHTVFHDQEQAGYIAIDEDGVRSVLSIRSQAFKRWLSKHHYGMTGKGCNANAIADALNTIEARAVHHGEQHPVFLRVANLGDKIYLDICDEKWRVIEISGDGWTILERSPVNFVRKKGMLPLTIPRAGGSIEHLRPFLNIHQDDFPLVVGWILAALRGKGPFPALVLQGEQGTGKSTTSRVIRGFIDPSSVPLRNPPGEVRDILVSAINNWLPCIDNLSGLPLEFSDALCRLSTGGGLDARQLYSDTDQVLIDIQRPVIVNGIDDIATRPDLAERSIILNLPVIDQEQRRQESEFWAEFEKDKPQIFGSLLDALAAAIKKSPTVKPKLLPRMADFAVWVTAAEEGLGWSDKSFMEAYTRNQDHALEAGLEASPVGSALVALMDRHSEWRETPTELLNTLSEKAGQQAKSKAWPQSPKGMKTILKRLAPSLRRMGITITQENGHGREYTITKVPKQTPETPIRPHDSTNPSNDAGLSVEDDGADSKPVMNACADNRPIGADSDLLSAHLKLSNNAGWGGLGGYSGACVNDANDSEVPERKWDFQRGCWADEVTS